jgi:antitoxin component YwqK of YwqJK toxin-antitoxin module
VSRYYKWIKITEHTITEMHGNKKHSYMLEFNSSHVREYYYINGVQHRTYRVIFINESHGDILSTAYMSNVSGNFNAAEYDVDRNLIQCVRELEGRGRLILVFYPNGQLKASIMSNAIGLKVGTSVSYDENGIVI